MSIIALFVVLIFTVASRPDRDYRASCGFDAPELSLLRVTDNSQIELADLRGRYVLVNFWAAYDAESRISAHDYDELASVADNERLCLLQVNLDPHTRLFREIVRRDGLKEAQQFVTDAADTQRVIRAFNLDSGLQSYLISPQGKVVAVNPSPETIAQTIAS